MNSIDTAILSCLSHSGATIDQIVEFSNIGVEIVSAVLTRLVLEEKIAKDGIFYIRL